MKILSRLLPFTLLAPFLAFAQQGVGNFQGMKLFLDNVIQFMNDTLVPGIFALAFLVFLWGMFKTFILGGGDEEKQSEGKQLMMYAIVGFVVMVSLWGIVNLLANGLGLREQNLNQIPNLPELKNPR